MTGRGRRLVAALVGLALVAGCGAERPDSQVWHDGRIFVATGNTTGVYYQLGGGYADLITQHLPGYEARAEPTGASVENITRVASGDMEIAFSLADTASDAVQGRGTFDKQPQPVRALARVYSNYTHVIVRTSGKIDSFADLRGKRVSTGSPRSGTDIIAGRLLTAAGMDPTRDIQRFNLSLPETVKQMRTNDLDAMFFAGGLPTPGVKDLLSSAPGKFRLLPLAELVEPLDARYSGVYTAATLPKDVYGTPEPTPTITVANVLVVPVDMPEQLAYDLTRVLFTWQGDLIRVHPEAANFNRASAAATGAVPLHPGALRFYRTG
ncbi:TAXI family TRAP transporter solute-binding subunit [Micromonospora sp. DT31]|uniref:TAXI family TRAP transporter solute-binding subunit n=1 Tax=Micromonospora sp. DT31 TaxID=3393434 RepID=UPI003CE6FB7A